MSRWLVEAARGLVGGVVGGVLGYLGFRWILSHGFYGLALPGITLGAGCGALSGTRSVVRGVLCGLAALALSLFSDWTVTLINGERPTFVYYLSHLQDQTPVTLLLIVVGTLAGYWFGKDALVSARGKRGAASEVDGV
jgi:hypothetical protein